MVKCLSCGTENGPNNRFCQECGATLQVICSQCGEKVGPNTKFCPNCGSRVGAPAATAAPTGITATVAPSAPYQAPTPPPPIAPAPSTPTMGYSPHSQPASATPPPVYGTPTYSPPISTPPPPPAYGAPASSPPPYTPPAASYSPSFPAGAAPAAPSYAAPSYQAAPAFRYKGVWPRFFAMLIDGILIGTPVYFVMQKLLLRSFETGSYSSGNMTITYMLPTVILLLYQILLEATGGTLGKRILGMKIVDAQGNKPGIGRSLARNLLRIIDALPFAIPYLLGILLVAKTAAKQRLGDKAAGTFVVGK